MNNYIITIARGLGSGGSHIGKKLCADLGIAYYDREILQMAADLSGINEKYFLDANEKINKGQITIDNSKGVYSSILYKPNDKKFLSDENLFNYQALVIKNIALAGDTSGVIIGKAANYILASLRNVVTVNIQAPIDLCIRNVSKRLGISQKEALASIEKTDKYRANYYKYFTGHEWNDPREYDICINTNVMGEDYAAVLIEHMLRDKGLIK